MNTIVHGLDIREYHRMPELSATGLSNFAKSPFHYFSSHRDPGRPEPEETQSQLEGQLTHCAILEPLAFNDRYPVGPDVRRNTKEWKAFVAEHPEAMAVIKPAQRAVALTQARGVRMLPQVAQLLGTGHAEVSAFWTDPATGVACRCRPDWVHTLPDGSVILVDIKTCGDASAEGFARQITRMNYHWQAAHYTRGYSLAAGVEVRGFVFVAIEMAWPQAVAPLMVDDEGMAKAADAVDALLVRFAECERTGTWPSYPAEITPVTLPAWA